MAKQLSIEDLFTKLSAIFKNDFYIIENTYLLGGDISEERNPTRFIIRLDPVYVNSIVDRFDNNPFIYIKESRKWKDDSELYTDLKISDDIRKTISNSKDLFVDRIDKIENWNSFNFTEESLHDIFKLGKTFALNENILLSKTMFPMVTEKNATNLYYNIKKPDKEEELMQFCSSFDTEWFQIYGLSYFIFI